MIDKKENLTDAEEIPTLIRRCGYEGSGFVFYFVRCKDGKAMARYMCRVKKNPQAMTENEAPVGNSYSVVTDVLGGLIPEAADCGGNGAKLVECHICAIAHPDRRTERRHWYHEIGHTLDALWTWYLAVCAATGHTPTRSMIEEAPAMFSEFLHESLDRFLENNPDPTWSGLDTVMPWLPGSTGVPETPAQEEGAE